MADLRDTLNLFARRFALALQSSTRMRAGDAALPGHDLEASSAGHVPGAGWLVGLTACLVFAVTAILLGDSSWHAFSAAVACTVATVLLTGGRNESGLYRFANGLGERDAGWGALALFLVLAAKFAVLSALGVLSEAGVMSALLTAHVVSRFAPLVARHWLDMRPEALHTLRVGALWCVLPLALVLLAGGAGFLALSLLACAAAGFALVRSTPAQPGRAAALQQVCELGFYLGAAIAA